MHIICLTPLEPGVYNDHYSDNITAPPDGWAYIPEDFPLPSTFPRLGSIEAEELTYTREVEVQKEVTKTREVPSIDEEGNEIMISEEYTEIETVIEPQEYKMMTVISMTEGELPKEDIDKVKNDKVIEIRESCSKSILAGIDVETSKGLEHFSLEETDQINLTTALSAIQSGATSYPYHADKELCRLFTAKEIQDICNASIEHKLYHTTLCNHLLTWIRRSEDVDEINSITYSQANMPDDLRANMMSILSSSQSLSL